MTWWHVLAFGVGVVVGAGIMFAYLWLWLAGSDGVDEVVGGHQ